MTKENIAKKVSCHTGLSRIKALEAVQAVFDTIKTALVKSDKPVSLRGFGRFVTQRKKKRDGRNPKTGEIAVISARRVTTFQASDALKDIVNSSSEN